MKNLENVQNVEKFFQVTDEEFEKRRNETTARMNYIREEMDRWRYPNKTKMVLSNRYR